VFLRTLGLDPSRTLQSAGALAAFYGGSVVLAFAAMSFTLWRHSGGSWRALLLGSRNAQGGARPGPGGAADFSQQLPGGGVGLVPRCSVDEPPGAAAPAAAAAGGVAAPAALASARERAVIQVDATLG
jgi:hypothetical protein